MQVLCLYVLEVLCHLHSHTHTQQKVPVKRRLKETTRFLSKNIIRDFFSSLSLKHIFVFFGFILWTLGDATPLDSCVCSTQSRIKLHNKMKLSKIVAGRENRLSSFQPVDVVIKQRQFHLFQQPIRASRCSDLMPVSSRHLQHIYLQPPNHFPVKPPLKKRRLM